MGVVLTEPDGPQRALVHDVGLNAPPVRPAAPTPLAPPWTQSALSRHGRRQWSIRK